MAESAERHALPSVTTVLPTYRRPHLLRRAAGSAATQAGARVVLRICDNHSGDDTGRVAASLADAGYRVDYVLRPQNVGATGNYVLGVQGITTPFFSLLADDDYLLPGFYRQAIEDLATHSEAMFWVGTTLNVSPDGEVWDARLERWPRDGIYSGLEGVLAMTGGLAPNWTGILFRREVLDAPVFIDPQAGGPADFDCTLRMAARYPFFVRRVPVAVSTLNPASFSATQPLQAFWPGWQHMLHNIAGLGELSEPELRQVLQALRRDARSMLWRRGLHAIAHGRPEFARDAAAALRGFGGAKLRAASLAFGQVLCRHATTQALVTALYRSLERRMVASRADLQARHRHVSPPAGG